MNQTAVYRVTLTAVNQTAVYRVTLTAVGHRLLSTGLLLQL